MDLGGSHYARRDIIKQKRFSITTGDDIGGQRVFLPFSPPSLPAQANFQHAISSDLLFDLFLDFSSHRSHRKGINANWPCNVLIILFLVSFFLFRFFQSFRNP